ncbi:ABC transporter permease [Nocardia jiangsuensis]|uniref:ABC transporter permease n=1 Tax=Nocardia jiangsuensis TaxID=1691563 RepID=A0ABV8DYK2_9NOCA
MSAPGREAGNSGSRAGSASDRPGAGTASVPRRAADFTGTRRLFLLSLRRDRVVAPLWALAIGLMPAVQLVSVEDLYSSQEQLAQFAATTAASPALLAMYGPVFGTSLGSIGTWKAGAMYTVIAIAAVLTVVRHTRVEEETGRAELVGATGIGRFAGLTAALLLTGGGSLVAGLVCALSLLGSGEPLAGSVAWGTSLAASGLVWAGIAAVAAQASTGARVARGIAFAALGTAFALRAAGDAGNGVLSWFSPLGWCLQIRPYAGERWWVLLPLLTVAVFAVGFAYALLDRRDTGAGLIAERPGRPAAKKSLSGAFRLAARLQRGALLGWAIGFALYGLLIGGAVGSVGDMLGDNDTLRDLMDRMGGSSALEDSFVTYALTLLAAVAAAYSVSALLRLHDEESSGRMEATLAGAVSRPRLAAAHLTFALGGPALLLFVASAAIGLVYAPQTADPEHTFDAVVAAAAVQLPAVWVVTGIATALYGSLPRFAPFAWGVLSAMIVLYFVGSLDALPQWVMDLVPFTHPPKLPGGEFTAEPLLWLLAIATILIAAGMICFRRRDLR